MDKKIKIVLTGMVVLANALPAFANVNQLKYYREINKDLKPDCMYCHIDKLPKKEEGKHELNAYGAAVKKRIEVEKLDGLSEDEKKAIFIKIYNEIGRHDQFKEEDAAAEIEGVADAVENVDLSNNGENNEDPTKN